VDVGRETFSNLFAFYFSKFQEAYDEMNAQDMYNFTRIIESIIIDYDRLMGTQSLYMLGKWIHDAESWAENEQEKQQIKFNAINQVLLK